MSKPIEPEAPPTEPTPTDAPPAQLNPAQQLLLGALLMAKSGTAPPCLLERATIH